MNLKKAQSVSKVSTDRSVYSLMEQLQLFQLRSSLHAKTLSDFAWATLGGK